MDTSDSRDTRPEKRDWPRRGAEEETGIELMASDPCSGHWLEAGYNNYAAMKDVRDACCRCRGKVRQGRR